MCEVQFIKRIGENLTETDRVQFIRLMKKGSLRNSHAFGLFNEALSYKEGNSVKEGKGKLKEIVTNTQTSFFIGHNRLATKGAQTKNRNNHPFETKNWKIVHNGVLHNDDKLKKKYKLKYKIETDSAIIIYLLEKFVREGLDPIKAIRKVAEEVYGSFSVMAYFKPTKKIYYFKSAGTSFYFGLYYDEYGKVILGSTSLDSIKSAYQSKDMIFPIKEYRIRSISEAKEEIIYEIDEKGIREVDIFNELQSSSYYNNYPTPHGHTSTYERYGKLKRFGDGILEEDVDTDDWVDVEDDERYYTEEITEEEEHYQNLEDLFDGKNKPMSKEGVNIKPIKKKLNQAKGKTKFNQEEIRKKWEDLYPRLWDIVDYYREEIGRKLGIRGEDMYVSYLYECFGILNLERYQKKKRAKLKEMFPSGFFEVNTIVYNNEQNIDFYIPIEMLVEQYYTENETKESVDNRNV